MSDEGSKTGLLKCEDLVDVLYDAAAFIFELDSGAVLPKTHPDYYDRRLFIRLIRSDIANVSVAEIGKDTFEFADEEVEKIKSILSGNFSNLVNIALKQSDETFVGGGTLLKVKIKNVNIMIDLNNVNSEDKTYINALIEEIVDIIKR